MVELIIFLLFVYSLTYLFVNDEYIFSNGWSMIVFILHLIMDKLYIFAFVSFVYNSIVDFIKNNDKSLGLNNMFLSHVNFSDEFLKLKSCFTCAAFWVSFITTFLFSFSVLNNINILGYIVFSIITTVFLTHIYKFFNYLFDKE